MDNIIDNTVDNVFTSPFFGEAFGVCQNSGASETVQDLHNDFEDLPPIQDLYKDFEGLQPILDFVQYQNNNDVNATSATIAPAEVMNAMFGLSSAVEDTFDNNQTQTINEGGTASTLDSLAGNINNTPTESTQATTPDLSNKKKRKLSDQSSGGGSTKKAKKEKTSIPCEQVASGFLNTGKWVTDAKFACVSCRRGHRAATCKEGMKGKPVQLVDHAGRPPKGVTKVDTTCRCGPEQCRCRHPSYLLEEVWVDGVQKLRIATSCFSDGKAQLVRCDAPCSIGHGSFISAMT